MTHALQAKAHQVFVRDQHPLNMTALAPKLEGVKPHEWLQLLNGRVFFWPTRDRLEKMLTAYRREPQAVFEIDARRFLERHGDKVELSHINSGFVFPLKVAPRGLGTFVPLADYPYDKKIAEVTVPHSVPDIFDVTQRVVEDHEGEPQRVLWP